MAALFLVTWGLLAGKLEYRSIKGHRVPSVSKGAEAGAGEVVYIPGVAHVAGANDTDWRTDLEVRATGNTVAAFHVELLKRDRVNSSPPRKNFQLAAGKSRRFADIVWTNFNFSGGGALRVTVTSGSVLVTSRTYNRTGSGTYGQFIAGELSSSATPAGKHCRLIQLTQTVSTTSGSRTNVGLVNTTANSFTVQADLYRANGTFLGSKNYALRAYEVRQVDRIFTSVTSDSVGDGYVILSTTRAGAAFLAYASVVDNATGDPVYEPAVTLAGPAPGGGAAPTPTPTPPSAANLDLEPYAPDGWSDALVVSGRSGTNTSGGLSGSGSTYIDWAFANWGPDDAVFPAGDDIVSILLDGATLVRFNSSSDFVLEGGYYYSYEDWETTDIGPGGHTVKLVVDPQDVVAETAEGNNRTTYTGQWGALAAPIGGPGPRIVEVPISKLKAERIPDANSAAERRDRAKTTATYFIPAAAHATGFGGSVWRTDVEIHNAGSTTMNCAIDLLKKDADNSAPATQRLTVAAGRAVRIGDILDSKFGFTGSAALRLRFSEGLPVVTSRTYNQTSRGTYGQFIGAKAVGEATRAGRQTVLIQLTHNRASTSGYRTNIGLLNCKASAIDVRIDLYQANGTKVGAKTVHLNALGFRQIDRIYESVFGGDLSDGYAVVSTTTPDGTFLAFGSVIDNRTGDPIYIPATEIDGGGGGGGGDIDVTGTMGPGELASNVGVLLEGLARNTGSNLGDVLVSIIDDGMEATLDSVVQAGATRITRGLEGEVATENSSGTIRGTYSGYTHTSTRATWDYEVTVSNGVFRNRAVPLTSVGGHVNAVKTGSAVVADISVDASGPDTSATGNAHVDTSVCETMPISGSIDISVGSATSTLTFTDQCGVYKISGRENKGLEIMSMENYQWRYVPVTCSDGSQINAPTLDFFVMTDGDLGSNPTGVFFSQCLSGWMYSGWASGTATDAELNLDFSVSDGNGNPDWDWVFTGSFDGAGSGSSYPEGYWEGTLRLHAERAAGGCRGDLILTNVIVAGCGMNPTSSPMCNDAPDCW